MKRGTLLLALALLLQGSTSLAVLGDDAQHKKLTKGQKRKARRALAEAKKVELERAQYDQQAQEVAQILAEVEGTGAATSKDECFEVTFGPHLRSHAADKATAQEQAEAAVAEATAAADAALAAQDDNAGWNFLGGMFDGAGAGAQAEPTAQEVAAQEAAQQAAQAQAEKDAAASALKAEQEATAKAFVAWQQTDGIQGVVNSIADASAQMKAKRLARVAALQHIKDRQAPKAELHKAVQTAATALAQRLQATPMQDPYTPVATEYDSEYSDVEGADTKEYATTQAKYTSWNPGYDLRNPATLLAHLQNQEIAPEHQQHFETLVAAACSKLTLQAESAMTAASGEDVAARKACVQANAAHMQTLNAIARAARLKKLNLTRATKRMMLQLQTKNDKYVTLTAQMATAEITGARITLNDDDFRLPTASRVIARAKRTKHDKLQGAQGTDNLAVITRALAELTAELQDGTADLETIASALDLLNSPKGIHVAPHVVKDLHEALAQVATTNSATSRKELSDALALNDRFEALTKQVEEYGEHFTDCSLTAAHANVDFLEQAAGLLPADDEADNR